MPINIPDKLPAKKILEKECIKVLEQGRATHQDIRPLEIAILNLMPTKETTETQWARLLGNTSLQINLTLFTTSRESKHTSQNHLEDFYKSFDDIKNQKFDGLIITGAPVEKLDFEEVSYWDELCDIFKWSETHVHASFYVCWASQAALYHFHQIPKYESPEKIFGVYSYKTISPSPRFVRGFNDEYLMPVSRHTLARYEDIVNCDDLQILSLSDICGVGYVKEKNLKRFYMLNHLEYDACSLHDEYVRDKTKGMAMKVPFNYYPDNNPHNTPRNTWRSTAFLMIANWLDYIYQTVPYEIEKIGE